MTPELWQRVRKTYEAVVGQEPNSRAAALAELCAHDEELRREVEELLAVGAQADKFLETPPLVSAAHFQPTTAADEVVGRRIGPYKLIRVIGHGGMSAVYLAERTDEQFEREVAIKLIWPGLASADIEHRVRRERQILANLTHPNIAALIDAGATEEGWPYLVMEYIAGAPITDYCRQRRLAITERLRLFRTVCDAVQYAHQNLVIHRDLKPSNILVTADGKAKLLDFGIAKLLAPTTEEAEQAVPTQSLLNWLTPEYASPEQLRGETVTAASDVYSLGVVLYELLTGGRPHRAKNLLPHEVVKMVCHEEPEKPSARVRRAVQPQDFAERNAEKLRRHLAGDLDNITLMALSKGAAERYGSPEQLGEDVRRHLAGEPVRARKATLAYRASRYARRHKLGVALAMLFVLALAAGSIAATVRAHKVEARTRVESRLRYAAQMRQAGYDLAEGDMLRLRATLQSLLPEAVREDLRGFEWSYLWREAHREKLVLSACAQANAVAYSPDGRRIAAACQDGTVKVWDAVTGQDLLLLNHPPECLSLAFSPDSRSLVTSGIQTVRLWDVISGRELTNWRPPVTGWSVAFAPDGKRLLLAGGREGIGSWLLLDLSTGKILLNGAHGGATTFAVAFLPGGRRFISGGDDGWLKIWDAASGRLLTAFHAHPDNWIFSLAVSADGRRVASAGGDKVAKLWDVLTGRLIATFGGHTSAVHGVAFSPDERRLVTASADRTIKLWDVASVRELTAFKGHTDRIRAVAFAPDGRGMASCGDDRVVRVWDVPDEAQSPEVLSGHTQRIFSVAFSPDGQKLATASTDKTVKLWEVATGHEIAALIGHAEEIHAVAFSSDGRYVATASADRTARIWEAGTRRPVTVYAESEDTGSALSVAFAPNNYLLAIGYALSGIALRDVVTGDSVAKLKGHSAPVWSAHFSPDGQRLASASWDHTIKLWDLASGRELFTLKGHDTPVTGLAFSPDGKWLATGADDHTAKLWDAATGRALRTLVGHADQVLTVAFSPDGRRLATGSSDQTVRIWEVETGQELLALRGHKDEVWSVAFSPDGQTLASGSWDKTVRLWRAAAGPNVGPTK